MLSGYNYRRAITLDYTKFSSGLTDFPLFVQLSEVDIDFSKFLTPGGLDVRFTSDDGDTLLKFERLFHGDKKTKLLLHLDNNLTDSGTIPKTLSSTNITFSSSVKKYGTHSAEFNGTDSIISAPNSSDFDFVAEDFTIDFHVNFKSVANAAGFYEQQINDDNRVLAFWNSADNFLQFYVISSSSVLAYYKVSWTPSINTWYHLAFVRNGSNFYIFIDGVSQSLTVTTPISTNILPKLSRNINTTVKFGRIISAGWYLDGYMDEIRVSKGIARWTTNFTPSSESTLDDFGKYIVKVPTVSSSVDTVIYMYYGKTSDTDGQDKSNTWDSYTKAVYHLSEIGAGVSDEYIDSKNGYDGQGGGGTASYTPHQEELIYGGQFFDGTNDYIQLPDEANLELGTSDFTISFKATGNAGSNYQCYLGKFTPSSDYFYFGYELGNLRFRDLGSSGIDFAFTWSPVIDQTYDIEVTRNGTLISVFIDGVLAGSQTTSASFVDTSNGWQIGACTAINYYAYLSLIDEVRFSIGIDRSSAWRSARISGDNDEINTLGAEEGVGEITKNINETVTLSDNWNISVSAYLKNIVDTVEISDSWNIRTNPPQKHINHTVLISDSWTITRVGTIIKKIATKLSTVAEISKKYLTNLTTGRVLIKNYLTSLYLSLSEKISYQTDLRLRTVSYDAIQIGTLSDYVIKLDGVELTDADYDSAIIILNLNSTPSRAEFTIARRHDDLDKTLTGATSVITNENKIQIYDGTTLLFTGYITEINSNSVQDVVAVVAEDIRYKFARSSFELEYGGQWRQDSNSNGIPDDVDPDTEAYNFPSYILFKKNIATAYSEIISNIGALISGYDNLPFSGSFVPEYVKSYNDYGSLLDEILRNTANVNWYIDENEKLRFQKIANGTIKTLNLSSLTLKRHPYDTIVNDVQLNKKPSNYAKSLNVKLGKQVIQNWRRVELSASATSLPAFLQNAKDKISFCFQQWGFNPRFYVGMNQVIYSYFISTGWILKALQIVQYKTKDQTNLNLSDITVGSGFPKKTIYLTSYGSKESNMHWEEVNKVSNPNDAIIDNDITEVWLAEVYEESYNYTDFATDLANFELSQSNTLSTSANVSLLLDAYKYYNINFSDLINLGNTIEPNIFKNNNGFPLNIQSVHFNLKNRTVDLVLTNYGKAWYAKSEDILKTYTPPSLIYKLLKQPVVTFSGL